MCRLIRRLFVTAGMLSVLLWTFASCSHDTEVTDVPGGEMTISVGFNIPTRGGGLNGFEEGNASENYIDIENNNYRIYFFDTNNILIARFVPNGFVETTGSNYRNYNVLGKAPDALVSYSAFKMVVLANWDRYDDENIKAGETTIGDICNADWAQFKSPANFSLNPGEKFLIPFYGVHEYENVTFKAGQATMLAEPVTLLRALAKVEVILDTTDDDSGNSASNVAFTDVTLQHYNAGGYCAPSNVYSQNDYGQGDDWDNDYLTTLHLIGGVNDANATSRSLAFHCLNKGTQTENERWVAYLSEYNNQGGDFSYIEVKLDFQTSENESYKVHFAEYENGKPDLDKPLNISRNNLYRFTITMRNGRLIVNVESWDEAFDNEYNFD